MNFSSDIWTVDEASYTDPEYQRRIDLLTERSRDIAHAHLPFQRSGYCSVCQAVRPIDFRSNHGLIDQKTGMFHIAYSETGVCLVCMVSSRKRFAVEMLRRQPANSRVYLTEHVTTMREQLEQQYPGLVSSEYLGDHAPGTIVNGIRHEDLHRLSFSDGSFDALLCLDVLEHVNDPVRCMNEMARVLAPGGLAVVTFPFFAGRASSVRRARLNDGGEIEYILPEEYHGNPLGGGALVFWELSWDMLQKVTAKTRVVHYWSALGLHLGAHRLAVLIEKAD